MSQQKLLNHQRRKPHIMGDIFLLIMLMFSMEVMGQEVSLLDSLMGIDFFKTPEKAIALSEGKEFKESEKSRIHYIRSLSYSQLKEYSKALEEIEKALIKQPEDEIYLSQKGMTYWYLSEKEKSFAIYKKLIESTEEKYEYGLEFLVVIGLTKEYKSQLDFCTYLLTFPLEEEEQQELNKKQVAAYIYLAEEKKDSLEESVFYYEEAIKIAQTEKQKAEACSELANYYESQELWEEAILTYERAFNYDQNNTKFLLLAYHIISVNTNQYKKAIPYLLKIIEIEPRNSKAYYSLGNVYIDLKDYELSLSYLNKAIEIESNKANYYFIRSLGYKGSRDLSSALSDAKKATELEPENEMYKDHYESLK